MREEGKRKGMGLHIPTCFRGPRSSSSRPSSSSGNRRGFGAGPFSNRITSSSNATIGSELSQRREGVVDEEVEWMINSESNAGGGEGGGGRRIRAGDSKREDYGIPGGEEEEESERQTMVVRRGNGDTNGVDNGDDARGDLGSARKEGRKTRRDLAGASKDRVTGKGKGGMGLRRLFKLNRLDRREWSLGMRALRLRSSSRKDRSRDGESSYETQRQKSNRQRDGRSPVSVESLDQLNARGDKYGDSSLTKRPRSRSQLARALEREALNANPCGLRWLRKRELGGWTPTGAGVLNEDVETWAEGKALRVLENGEYLEMDRARTWVRSTICITFSSDEKFFASTHGDHTVKVWTYPELKLFKVLEGHPRTPWTAKFHPTNSYRLASGCLGKTCRVWNTLTGVCLYSIDFDASISCLAFHPAGRYIAVTTGRKLELWDYAKSRTSRELRQANPFHMVEFHPSGNYILSGEKNITSSSSDSSDGQFTLRLTMDHFDAKNGVILNEDMPPLIIARAIAYNDAGVHFSPCGKMLVACIPLYSWKLAFQIAVLALPGHKEKPGTILSHAPLDSNHRIALTNVKFSSSSRHILAGYSFRKSNPILKEVAEEGVPVVDIYRLSQGVRSPAKVIKTLRADIENELGDGELSAQDEINIAVFTPGKGYSSGLLYGTQKGRIRAYRHQARTEKVERIPSVDKLERMKSKSSSNVMRPSAGLGDAMLTQGKQR